MKIKVNRLSDNEQKNIFSSNLQKYIKQSGKDQKDIAADLEVNPPTFNQWATGKAMPSVSMIRTLADYFHVNFTDLVDDKSPLRQVTVSDKSFLNQKPMSDDAESRAYLDYLIEAKFENDVILIEINKRLAEMNAEAKERILNYIKFVEKEGNT